MRPSRSGSLRFDHLPVIQEARRVTLSAHRDGLDICSFLDDGLCAGTALALHSFLSALVEGFRRIGLEVNLNKTEIIPSCTTTWHPTDTNCQPSAALRNIGRSCAT